MQELNTKKEHIKLICHPNIQVSRVLILSITILLYFLILFFIDFKTKMPDFTHLKVLLSLSLSLEYQGLQCLQFSYLLFSLLLLISLFYQYIKQMSIWFFSFYYFCYFRKLKNWKKNWIHIGTTQVKTDLSVQSSSSPALFFNIKKRYVSSLTYQVLLNE